MHGAAGDPLLAELLRRARSRGSMQEAHTVPLTTALGVTQAQVLGLIAQHLTA